MKISKQNPIFNFISVKSLLLFLIIFSISLFDALGQKPLANTSYSNDVRTVQVYPQDNPLGYPFIGLNSGEMLEFHFDVMSTELNYYNYGVIHCNHDWLPSDLQPNEYIQGFQTNNISEFEAGFSTMYDYIHYRFMYPNDMSKPRYSGNYLMVVFNGQDINDRTQWLISCRFLIYENVVSILSNVTQSSIVASRYTAQEVDFDINYKGFTIYDPMREVNVSILQNMQWDNAKQHLKPIFLKPDVLTFDYSMGENVFEAGNEWRNFDLKSLRYISPEVESIMKEADGYNIYLRPDIPEGKKAYATWPDLNGNYLIKNDEATDSQLEADYVWVHFKLVMPEIPESEIIVEGKYHDFNNTPVKCSYDKQLGAYVGKAFLKQGYYNYRYVVRDRYLAKDVINQTEGSYAATENDYHIVVYMYDRNKNCDRIITVKADNSVR
jgi:hypothetical protein